MLQRNWNQTLLLPIAVVLVIAVAVLSYFLIGSVMNLVSTTSVSVPAVTNQTDITVPFVADTSTTVNYQAWDAQVQALTDSWLAYQDIPEWGANPRIYQINRELAALLKTNTQANVLPDNWMKYQDSLNWADYATVSTSYIPPTMPGDRAIP